MVGVASIVAGLLYTGGPRPYGYEGFGELFVFLFFGVVAVAGSYFVQTEEVRWEAFALSVPVGLLAAAILVVNNVRDVDTDRRAGKRTLAVKLGRLRAVRLFAAMWWSRSLVPVAWRSPRAGRGCCSRWPRRRWRPRCCGRSRTRRDGPALNGALADTGRLLAVFSLLLAAGVVLCREALRAAPVAPAARAFRDLGRRGRPASSRCCASRTTTAWRATARRRRWRATTA